MRHGAADMSDVKCAGDFRSDNVAGVSPTIMAAIVAANEGTAASYGDDEVSSAVNASDHPARAADSRHNLG